MLGFAQLSLRDSREPLPERHKLRIAHVVAGGEHLLRVLDDAVLLSRIESGSLALSVEPSDLAELIRAAIATLEPMAAAAGVSLERFVPPEPAPPVALDRKRVLQILIKYGTNATKYNVQGGSVSFA
ncbi:MAG TPA: hybrid sensor histidine kinase/response regulator, partial [Polyangiaceae bacterium]